MESAAHEFCCHSCAADIMKLTSAWVFFFFFFLVMLLSLITLLGVETRASFKLGVIFMHAHK